jgi:hypothetical protein
MKHASQQRTAGGGMAVGVLIFGSVFWLSCQPGELPCDQDQWQAICAGQTAGGAGGSTTPPPAAAPGGGGAAPPSAAPPAAVTATTAVMDCAMWPTLGDMDKFFLMRCGVSASCHGTGALWTDMQKQGVWERFKTDKAKVSCMGSQLANPTSWSDSVIWRKTQSPAMCPGGSGSAGLTMPPQMTYEPKMPALSQAELKCLEGFLKAISGGK